MHVPTLNIRIQVLPAFAPLNKKKKIVKESVLLNVESNLFTLHLERVQLPKRVLNSLPNILKIDDSQAIDEPKIVKKNDDNVGKIAKCLATFSVGAIPLSWKQSVMFAVISDTNAEDKHQSSAKFSQLLNFLVEINQNLIIDLNGELAILQPISCSLGTLICLKEAFIGPMKNLFQLQNVQHLSKKMVATLLDEVMSLKNNSIISQRDEGNEPNQNTAEPQTKVSLVDPVRTNQRPVKLERTQSSRNIGRTPSQLETGSVTMGIRKPKRALEEPDGMKSPKRMKRSYESPQKKSTLRHSKLSRTKSAASWRGQLILEKSKEMRQKSFVADDDASSCLSVSQGDSFGKSGNAAVATFLSEGDERVVDGISELKSKEDFLEFLKTMYKKALEEEGALTSAKNVVRATVQYFTRQMNSGENSSDAGLVLEETYRVLTEHILSSNLQIRDKYVKESTAEADELKLKELQMQCLLYCEVDSVCSSTKICCEAIEPRHEKVVAMLRAMSFIKDTNFLSVFLNTIILENYHQSSPRFLYKIYDSLLYPLPIQLEYLMSPDKLEDDFLLASPVNADASIASLITNPKVESTEMELDQLLQMERQTRLSSKNQRSISFTQAPRMKIELPAKQAPQQRRSERIASTAKPLNTEEKDHKSKVRRSLFNDRSPEPSPNKKHQTPAKTMPAHYVLKTKQVRETPVGRQGVNRYLRKQEKLLQNLSSNDITFVEETPEKESEIDASFMQPESKLDISASFYSSKHMTARFAHLEKRMTETRPQFLEQIPVQLPLSQVVPPLKSPKRRVTARMLFGSPVSPSPQKSVLKTIVEEKADDSNKTRKSPQSPPFRSPRRQRQQQQQTFKTPESVKSPKARDVPEKLLKARRAILMTPSPTRKASGPKITSPKSSVVRTPSPRKLTASRTPRKS